MYSGDYTKDTKRCTLVSTRDELTFFESGQIKIEV